MSKSAKRNVILFGLIFLCLPIFVILPQNHLISQEEQSAFLKIATILPENTMLFISTHNIISYSLENLKNSNKYKIFQTPKLQNFLKPFKNILNDLFAIGNMQIKKSILDYSIEDIFSYLHGQMDVDADGKSYKNPTRFAFCVFPLQYGVRGRDTFLIDKTDTIYIKDKGRLNTDSVVQFPNRKTLQSEWQQK